MARVNHATLVVNPSSGAKREGIPADELRSALASAGVGTIELIELTRGLDLKAAIMRHRTAGTHAVIAAGGDGTVSAVASVVAGTDAVLGVLPAGTLNHFAGDLGIPADIPSAAAVIAAGQTIRVDVGEVNGRTFVNNSSIGFYPAMVRMRERLMRKGLPKRIAMVGGAAAAFWDFPNTSVRLTTGKAGLVTRTPFVFVGNNVYEMSGMEAASRKHLQEGTLQICIVKKPSRFALARAVVLSVMGNHEAAPELLITTAKEAQVETLRTNVAVALDGEVVMMRSPLAYSVLPGALQVLVPEA